MSVGHCNEEVVAATVEQMRTADHTSTLYLNDVTVKVAEKIAAITPGRLQKSFFTSSGTEAIHEVAQTVLERFNGARAFYSTVIKRGEDVLAEVKSSWCCIDAETLRPARIGEHMREFFFLDGD